jgi:hypothetical protein
MMERRREELLPKRKLTLAHLLLLRLRKQQTKSKMFKLRTTKSLKRKLKNPSKNHLSQAGQ